MPGQLLFFAAAQAHHTKAGSGSQQHGQQQRQGTFVARLRRVACSIIGAGLRHIVVAHIFRIAGLLGVATRRLGAVTGLLGAVARLLRVIAGVLGVARVFRIGGIRQFFPLSGQVLSPATVYTVSAVTMVPFSSVQPANS